MGVVHLAEAADGRRVALKVLRPHVVGDDEARQRLAREVASLRQVRSDHIATILDADPWGETPYVVTRYVPGHSLDEVVRRDGPLSAPDLEHAARGLLQAVRDVHAADVLHRDIKPTNVVMEGRAPILIDFGLARLAEDPRLTATGWLLGTPGYLAPEVLLGDQATAATDVHGWAATLAYAATGRPPYGRGHTMAILDRTRRGEFDLSGAPTGLRSLLEDCLAVEPLDRPTITELRSELDGVSAATQNLAVQAPPARQPPAPTMPWQLLPHADPPTEVIAPVPPTSAWPTSVQPTSVRPVPILPPPPTTAPPSQHRPVTGWVRLRHSVLLLGLGVVSATSFRLAPYLTLAVLAVAVAAVRGISRSQEAAWRRRSVRGQRWSDGPRAVAGYPWHALRGSAGAVVLMLYAAITAGLVTGALGMLGSTPGDALLGGGVTLAAATWWGPASRRVRQPVGQAALAVAREPVVWGLVGATLTVLAVLGWLAFAQSGVNWSPGTGAPWRELRRLVPDRPPWF
jgi:serine/threonine protein kinase